MGIFESGNKGKIEKKEGIRCLCVEEYPLEEKMVAEGHKREAEAGGFIAHCLYDAKLRNYGVWVSEFTKSMYPGMGKPATNIPKNVEEV